MRLLLSPLVKHDLAEIANYIAQDSPRHAAVWVRMIRARFQWIASHPQLCRLRPELGNEARLATVGQYVILYRIRTHSVRIERVVHGSRDLLPLLEDSEQ